MKKILIVAFLTLLILTGCGNLNDKTIKDNFIKDINNLSNYHLEGDLELSNNDDVYKYEVKVSYKNKDYYKVELNNKANNYKQIILRNDEGIYVYTPSLNKSFKFQSEWPYNNSQVYILKSLAEDLSNDNEYEFKQENDNYIFTTKVNYPNNPKLIKQNIILDKNYQLKEVEVLDKDNISLIKFMVTNYDNKPTFNNDYFELKEEKINIEKEDQKENEKENKTLNDENINKQENEVLNEEDTKETANLDDSLFPMYLPNNTALTNKETIATEDGERIIMTFSGDKPFILVEETASVSDELTIIPTYGEPYLLIDTVGSLTDISYTWTSNNVEYYIVSDVLEQNELLEVAKSIGVVATINEK